MQATLSTRVKYSDVWDTRAYFVMSEPLGIGLDTAAAALMTMSALHGHVGHGGVRVGHQMLGTAANPDAAANIHELELDGTFQTRRSRLQVVCETLFSPSATLGYGNLWTTAVRSRASLVKELKGPLCVATGAGGAKLSRSVAVADEKAVECLRGLLGEPRMIPALGVLSSTLPSLQ